MAESTFFSTNQWLTIHKTVIMILILTAFVISLR